MLKIEFDGAFAYLKNLPAGLSAELEELLSYTDRSIQFNNMRSRSRWGQEDPVKSCYDRKSNKFLTGLLSRVVGYLNQRQIEFEITPLHKPIQPKPKTLPDWLYAHQVQACELALDNVRCGVEIPTGGGKTTIAAEYAGYFPDEQILICVPKSNLMKDMAKRVGDAIGEEVGQWGGNKKSWKRVTVGIIDSLVKLAEADDPRLPGITVVIYDEAHRIACDSNVMLAEKLVNAEFVLSLSATLFREDGKDLLVEGVSGPSVLRVPEKELIRQGVIMAPYYICIDVNDPGFVYKGASVRKYNGTQSVTYFTPNQKPKTEYVYEKAVIEYETRNQLIATLASAWADSPLRLGSGIIFVKSKNHGELIQQACAELGLEVPFFNGENCTDKERDKLMDDLRAVVYPIVITTEILNEGADITNLGLVILAGAEASEKNHTQQRGRVMRTHPGKKVAFCIDICDQEKFYLAQRSYKRKTYITNRLGAEFVHKMTLKQTLELLNGTRPLEV